MNAPLAGGELITKPFTFSGNKLEINGGYFKGVYNGTQDSDNAFGPKNVDEVDGQQWRFSVPMESPTNVTVPYGANVSAKLVPVVAPYAAVPSGGGRQLLGISSHH